MRSGGRVLLVLLIIAGTAVLMALGFWQVARLHWKEALIARVESRMQGEPRPLPLVEAEQAETGDIDYMPVSVTGEFLHEGELYFFTTHDGQSGWNVFAPLRLEDGRLLFVNRGFVPAELRDPATRSAGQVEGEVAIEGLARNFLGEKPNPFIPENDPAARTLFWRGLADMAAAADVDPGEMLPFYVDAGASPVPGGWPLGGTTYVSFSNNHLGYAITWFGLAFSLVAVGAAFLLRGRKSGAPTQGNG